MPSAKSIVSYLVVLHVAVIVSCLVSTMALFMGGGQSGADLFSLMAFQAVTIPASVSTAIFGVAASRPYSRAATTAEQLYNASPQWLIFCCLMLISLSVFGETAFLIVSTTTDTEIEWTAHVPLVAMTVNSFAVCLLYASRNLMSGKTTALSGRWTATADFDYEA